ncbi:hypothetical protein R1sor_000507 [Riccia sorocarpa]|uniref:Replitron HUH endonuclease domain-containing protein n=1 Tax=Riccia sorocarpa TaxID=122646 RepID=A0ABD3GTA3_9MARC
MLPSTTVGIINSKWTEERQDWYLNGLEFVCIRKLEHGRQSVAGPFKLVRKEGKFVILEAADKSHFSHPRFMKKTSTERTEFSSPAAWSGAESVFAKKTIVLVRVTTLKRQAIMKQKTIPETIADPSKIAETTMDPSKKPPAQKPNESAAAPSKDKVKLKAKESAPGQSKPTRKPRTVAAKDLDLSITVGIAGEDVSGETFDKLAQFINKNPKMGIISFERGDAHLLLHIQGMISIKSSSTRMVKAQIRQAIGWEDDGPLGGSICIKSLRDKGLHTIVGIIGYCLKDEKEEHFRFFQKNITDKQMEEGKRMHSIYGASAIKNRLQLTPTSILTRALQFWKYRAKSPISTTFRKCIREMISCGQYIPALKWISMPTQSPDLTIKRAEKLWTSCIAPETITIKDIDEIFFGYRRPERYARFTHPTEMMLADAIHGRKFDSDGVEYHTDDDEPTADPNIAPKPPPDTEDEPTAQVTIKPGDMKPEPDTSMYEGFNEDKGGDDDCQEIVDMDAPGVVKEGEDPNEVAKGLVESGYPVLMRVTKKQFIELNERDIPGLNGGPLAYISLH